jgi:hypothetical protein
LFYRFKSGRRKDIWVLIRKAFADAQNFSLSLPARQNT